VDFTGPYREIAIAQSHYPAEFLLNSLEFK
jgi:hypothetical protein